jgi:universal stress protein A
MDSVAGNLPSMLVMAIKRILVPVDFSAPSLQALDYAVDFARPLAAELVVLFVVEPIYSINPGELYAPASEFSFLMREQRRHGKEQLAQIEARLTTRYAKIRTALQEGLAYQAIVAAAKRQKADLIVMATHGRTGLSHLFMGSVTEKVVRTAGCPVLTVRVGGERRRKRRAR